MEYRAGNIGRIFIVRFDHGDDIHEKLKEFALAENIVCASVNVLGAVGSGEMVTGPKGPSLPAEPNWSSIEGEWEALAFGLLIENNGDKSVHLHSALGRQDMTKTGCVRKNIKAFITVEAVVTEILNVKASKYFDGKSGCNLLKFN